MMRKSYQIDNRVSLENSISIIITMKSIIKYSALTIYELIEPVSMIPKLWLRRRESYKRRELEW